MLTISTLLANAVFTGAAEVVAMTTVGETATAFKSRLLVVLNA